MRDKGRRKKEERWRGATGRGRTERGRDRGEGQETVGGNDGK